MSDFPLLSLTPLDLQKVINKLKDKSYFRLQQTCQDVEEFIRSSRRISVNLNGRYFLSFNGKKSSWEIYFFDKQRRKVVVDPDALYGTRLEELVPPVQNMENFKKLRDSLKENQITCEMLDMHLSGWSVKHCVAFFEAVKPGKIDLDSRNSARYEALFGVKTMKKVAVQLDLDVNCVNVAEGLFSICEDVAIHMKESKTLSYFLENILKMLHSVSFPNLKKFCLEISGDKNLPSSEYCIMKQLENQELLANYYSVTVEHKSIEETIAAYLNSPHFDSLYAVTIIGSSITVVQYSCLGYLYSY